MKKRALITGITGQDGSYLAELLLRKGYEVHGLVRRSTRINSELIRHLYKETTARDASLILHHGDMGDGFRLASIISEVKPHEVYNLAAQSHVRISFDEAEYTGEINGLGTTRILEAIRRTGVETKFYQAATSEMYGQSLPPQNEETGFQPRSPYGAAKVYAYWMTKNYRDAHGLFAVNGILFNHESPRRGEDFVTRKITRAVARIQAGEQKELVLGNLEAVRDWGYAPEYVEGMWRMLQSDTPDDYVLATGVGHNIRDFLSAAFEHVGLNWQDYVQFDAKNLRPTEVDLLVGDASKAKRELNWQATIDAMSLARLMVDADIEALNSKGQYVDCPTIESWNV